MKKLIGVIAVLGLAVSISAGVNYTDTADERHPQPLVVDEV
ncbi:hypothetical protein SAMN05192559_101709 [Halobacillus karajensis]|uniref:Phr family secreted Rap phosphatase inhibitor n=1 Tax=Halobacillus karajensis TaxID=195088 RepID=A0A024P5K9_9BACI|nr:hypothetical protein [Halobacillus karajensis]CDQ18676.1 hypothetical protein BN982_00953 [Halobacillus karajensis]CDQ23252.1 hypothetical protein BN983_01475 [Halobacillus karajensis]CDQ26734.1 hypothetical protein BN981_00955 [Halobacillus karajensis]SEH48279.1 hypothetical protein SAMN05192559_101709 [Halobacillus karajensis]